MKLWVAALMVTVVAAFLKEPDVVPSLLTQQEIDSTKFFGKTQDYPGHGNNDDTYGEDQRPSIVLPALNSGARGAETLGGGDTTSDSRAAEHSVSTTSAPESSGIGLWVWIVVAVIVVIVLVLMVVYLIMWRKKRATAKKAAGAPPPPVVAMNPEAGIVHNER